MKAITLIVFSLFLSISLWSQNITATNFIQKAACSNNNCIQPFLKTKAYDFVQNVGDNGDTTFYYKSNTADANNENVIRFQTTAESNTLTHTTYYKATFDALLKGFTALGFTTTTKIDGAGTSEYTSTKYPMYLLTADIYGSPDDMAYSFILTYIK